MKTALDKHLAQSFREPVLLPLRSGERTLRAYSYVWAAVLAVRVVPTFSGSGPGNSEYCSQ